MTVHWGFIVSFGYNFWWFYGIFKGLVALCTVGSVHDLNLRNIFEPEVSSCPLFLVFDVNCLDPRDLHFHCWMKSRCRRRCDSFRRMYGYIFLLAAWVPAVFLNVWILNSLSLLLFFDSLLSADRAKCMLYKRSYDSKQLGFLFL